MPLIKWEMIKHKVIQETVRWSAELSKQRHNFGPALYESAFERIYVATKVSKLRSFQYRLLKNTVLFNDRLSKFIILYHLINAKTVKLNIKMCNICIGFVTWFNRFGDVDMLIQEINNSNTIKFQFYEHLAGNYT